MANKKPGDEGGIKNLFAQHVEKAALGVAALMVFVFLYFGMSNKPLGQDKEPVALERDINSADENVKKPTWGPWKRTSGLQDPNYREKAAEDSQEVNAMHYALRPLEPDVEAVKDPRLDPKLIPVAKIEVGPGVIVALASKLPRGGGGGLGDLGRIRGGGGLLGSGGGGDEEPPVLNDEQFRALQVGFQPADRQMAAVGEAMVVLRGIIPVAEQQKNYDVCFRGNRMGYDEANDEAVQRDRPQYIYYWVERQEVDAKGNPVEIGKDADGEPLYWRRLNTASAMKQVEAWPPVVEPADPRFVDEKMTMRPPPILLRDYVDLIMHADVPLQVARAEMEDAPKAADGYGGGGEDLPGDLPPVFDPSPGGAEGIEPGRQPGAADEAGVGSGEATAAKPVDFKLFRFYDFAVEPSKRYKYRVKLLLEDPNNPKDKSLAPSSRFLDDQVAERLAAQKKADQASNRHTYYRFTDWSEESEVIGFPGTSRILAGGVEAGLTIDVPGSKVKIQRREPRAQVMALTWNPNEAVWVPGVVDELLRGDVVNFTKDVWVVDPVGHKFRQLGGYEFKTGYVMADLAGGDLLPSTDRKSKLTAPGEILLIGEDGSLEVRTEFDDADSYNQFFYTAGSGDEGDRPRPSSGRGEEEGGRGDGHDLDLLGG